MFFIQAAYVFNLSLFNVRDPNIIQQAWVW